jgi:hypothetical protein
MSDPHDPIFEPPTDAQPSGAFTSAASEVSPASETIIAPQSAQVVRSVQAEPEDAANGPIVRQTHVVRGVLWGLVLGVGLAIVLVLTTTIALDLVQMILAVVGGVILGTAWSLFAPPKK